MCTPFHARNAPSFFFVGRTNRVWRAYDQNTMRRKRFPAALSIAVALVALTAPAQDVAKVNAKSVTVKLENADARLLDVVLKPGQKEALHSHPASIVYVLDGGTVRSHPSAGKVTEMTYAKGDVIDRGPLTHWAENIGKTTIHLLLIELKNASNRSR